MSFHNYILISITFIGLYLIGSINFSIIAARLFCNANLLQIGSKNPGATNLSRITGKKIAIVVLSIDILRGFIAFRLLKNYDFVSNHSFIVLLSMLFLLLGNLFPVFHKFKGGKTVAMSIGILTGINFYCIMVGIIAFLITILLSKKVSAASLCLSLASLIYAIITFLNIYNILLTAIIFIIITVRHVENIKRLISGKEPNAF